MLYYPNSNQYKKASLRGYRIHHCYSRTRTTKPCSILCTVLHTINLVVVCTCTWVLTIKENNPQCRAPLVLSTDADARPILASNAAAAKSDVTEISPVGSVSHTKPLRVSIQTTVVLYLAEQCLSRQVADNGKTLHCFLAMSRHTRQPRQGRYGELCPRLESSVMGIG